MGVEKNRINLFLFNFQKLLVIFPHKDDFQKISKMVTTNTISLAAVLQNFGYILG